MTARTASRPMTAKSHGFSVPLDTSDHSWLILAESTTADEYGVYLCIACGDSTEHYYCCDMCLWVGEQR